MEDLVELDRSACQWIANPHAYFKAFSPVAKRFQRRHPSERLRTMTLVGLPGEFLARRPVRFHVWETTTPVRSWQDVLLAAVGAVARTRPDLVRALDQAGLVPWMVRLDPGVDLLEAFRLGRATLRLDSLAEAFRKTQWLLLMAGVKLNEAIVQVNPYTDEEWKVREAEMHARRADERRILREIDEKRRLNGEEPAAATGDAEGNAATDGTSGGFVF